MLNRVIFLLFLLSSASVFGTDVIIVGSGGDETYRTRFADWGKRLETVLVEKMGRKASEVHLLAENGADGERSDLATLTRLFAELAASHSSNDPLFVYLIGHGSYLRGMARFQIPGPDLDAAQLGLWLDKVSSKGVVIINGASASAPFINTLSGPGRVICSATKSGTEQNATEFIGFFLRALEEDVADRDHDQRISIWEAARQGSVMTRAWYKGNGLVATEHAILDDNGDQLGTRLVEETGSNKRETTNTQPDGERAREVFLKDFIWPEAVPKPLIKSYLEQVEKARALEKKKAKMGAKAYYQELERIMLAAARIHTQIRAYP